MARCDYTAGGMFCPLPGALDDGGKWWCRLHLSNRPRGDDAHDDLRKIIDNQTQVRADMYAPSHCSPR